MLTGFPGVAADTGGCASLEGRGRAPWRPVRVVAAGGAGGNRDSVLREIQRSPLTGKKQSVSSLTAF
jgi:tripartite-type tricarboxylate transporter receptor subunit TctC